MPYYQPKNEQAMVHAAIGFAKASRATLDLRLFGLDRPRRDQHADRGRDRDRQPGAGAAAPVRHFRDTASGPADAVP